MNELQNTPEDYAHYSYLIEAMPPHLRKRRNRLYRAYRRWLFDWRWRRLTAKLPSDPES